MLGALTVRLKDALNRVLHGRGYALTWLPPRVLASPAAGVALSFPMLAAHLMLRRPKPFFIGIGANDGVTHDPLFPFVREFGWPGVMIEPIPEAFAALRRNYTAYPDVALVCAAIGQTDGEGEIYSVDVPDADALAMTLHSSFDRATLLTARRWHPDIERRVVARPVRIVTFATLLRELEVRHVDVIKIDTEGLDLQILRSIDLTAVRPRLIMAEHANLSRADKVEMADVLLDAGYRVAMTPLDMLGYRET